MTVGHYDLMAAARRYRAGGTGPKATLLALVERMGEHDDDEWTAWPKQTTIAYDSEQSVRTVRRHLSDFEATKLLTVEARSTPHGRLANVYVLNVEQLLAGTPQPDTMTGCATGQPEQPNRTPDAPPLVAGDRLLHISQEQEEATTERAPAKRATACPSPFMLTADMRAWAAENAPAVDVSTETAQFTDHHRAKGSTYKDWLAAWRTWMRNAQKWSQNGRGTGTTTARRNPVDATAANGAEFLRIVNGSRA